MHITIGRVREHSFRQVMSNLNGVVNALRVGGERPIVANRQPTKPPFQWLVHSESCRIREGFDCRSSFDGNLSRIMIDLAGLSSLGGASWLVLSSVSTQVMFCHAHH